MARREGREPASARQALLDVLEREVALLGTGDGDRRLDPRVLEALAKVPREHFVPAHLAARAYDNRPLPIGHGQTISQPLIVAIMTHLLRLRPEARVLEVGTGSGYQTAILAELAREVVTIEVVEDLAAAAQSKLEALGYHNIEYRDGDGAGGCPERAPFDGIMVTAAARTIPAGADRAAGAGRPPGDPDRSRSAQPGPGPGPEGRARRGAPTTPVPGRLRAIHRRGAGQ